MADTERQVQAFVALRSELVRVSRSQGAAEAIKLGNNAGNRANRQALNATITTRAQQNAADVAALAQDLGQFQATKSIMLPAVTAGVILSSVILVPFLLIGGITRPIARIVEAMRRIAGAEFDVAVPDRGKHDEIGQIAGAIEVFRVQAVENKLQTAARDRSARLRKSRNAAPFSVSRPALRLQPVRP